MVSYINKEGVMGSGSLCVLWWLSFWVQQPLHPSVSLPYSESPECDNGQVVQTETSDPNGVISESGGG